ncbi:tetraspanin-18-like [Patiria miniata]|uniref:Tetraspanin n=1 Tax=Patiria miniata TaxID=46514 RepID=A0A913ZMD5_PATMI|nr:tetraspanin-18-like [Patiria miniata]XP_038052512.1 tetraspanin-18-like [Patiria miniata]XP_038052517.1 tetraspanin-18-like [Patiria miniata]
MTMEGCGAKCIKFLLFVINFIVALCGLGLIATGLLIKFGAVDFIPIDDVANLLNSQLLRSAVYIIIAAGGFVFLVAVCGCFGALCESKCLLVLYFLLLFIVFAGQIAAGILAALYTRQITDYLTNESRDFLKTNYNNTNTTTNEFATAAWDLIQTKLECCGVEGSADYAGNTFIVNDNLPYPKSCCPSSECSNNVVRSNGCQSAIEKLISDYGTIIGATAVGVAFFELCCMLLAICVCRNVDSED